VTRCQLPAYSPLAPAKLIGAGVRATLAPGSASAALERHLKERFQAAEVVLTSSGTHALQLALTLAAATKPWAGRAVALPAYTCYDVATAAVGARVSPTFYDVDPTSLSPDGDSLRRALAEGAGVVVASYLYGFPLDWEALRGECEAAGALLVEDAAQGLGSRWGAKDGGTFGDLTVLSFGRGKGWTGGGGGALLMRPAFLAQAASSVAPAATDLRAASLAGNARAFGVSLAQWALGRPSLYGVPSSIPSLALGETRYKDPTPPAAMGAFSAAAALAHAVAARRELEARRRNAERWTRLLEGSRRLSEKYLWPQALPAGSCGHLRLPALAETGGAREELVDRAGSLGMARGYPLPLPELPALIAPPAERSSHRMPGARDLAHRLFTLPTHSRVASRDLDRVAALL